MGSNPIARALLKSAERPRRRSQVERQRSAKPRSRVQIPSSPLRKWAGSELLSAICLWRAWGGGGMADAADLKSAGVIPRVGSNPTRPIGQSLSLVGEALLFPKVMFES